MQTDSFSKPQNQRYFEDYEVGSVHEYGPVGVSAEEIIEYATRYDAQPMHTDPVAAKASPFGELIASGWHTVGLMMQLYVGHYLSSVASLVSPGIDAVRWPAPVRPDDALIARVTVAKARRSKSKPDRGLVHSDIEVVNQNGQTVLTMTAMNLFLCRHRSDE